MLQLHSDLFANLRRLGGYIHPAVQAVATDGQGTGLKIVGEPIQPGQIIIGVPPPLQLSWASSSPTLGIASAVEQLLPDDEQWDMRCAVALLALEATAARSGDAYWQAYLDTLPDRVPGLPANFASAELRQVGRRYPALPSAVAARAHFVRSLADALQLPAPLLGRAYSMVTSRAFSIDGVGAPGCLLPLIDLANHAFEPSASVIRLTEGLGCGSAHAHARPLHLTPDT